jgi:hypothetical protein
MNVMLNPTDHHYYLTLNEDEWNRLCAVVKECNYEQFKDAFMRLKKGMEHK